LCNVRFNNLQRVLLSSRVVTLACLYAVAGWIVFTGLLIALGDVLLRPISRPVTPPVVVGLAALTALAVAVVSLDYFRRAGRSDLAAGLMLGTCVASIGLSLDAVLLLATRFEYPNVAEEKTSTLVAALMLGYAVAAAVPPLVAAHRGPSEWA
jgi:hypothetical protein